MPRKKDIKLSGNSLVAVVFSKNRPLQLSLTLSGLSKCCLDAIDTVVLYTTTSFDQERAYDIVKTEYPTIRFCKENQFKANLLHLLYDKTHVLFLVDDCIFVNHFSIKSILSTYLTIKTLGFSLRLGLNINYCYPMRTNQKLKAYTGFEDFILENWGHNEYDFGYPLELSSSLYSIDTIKELLESGNYNNPNQLESYLDFNKGYFRDRKPLLAMFKQSVTFCAPMNKVQIVSANNRSSENDKYSVDNLLKLYLDGVRINPDKFYSFVPMSPHQEVEVL